MTAYKYTTCVILFLIFTLTAEMSKADMLIDKKHIEVSLRMVGHQILLGLGDSSSRVLPVKENNGQFIIEFESEFAFDPSELAYTVVKTMEDYDFDYDYIMEVEDCESAEIVYSFEKITSEQKEIVPCQSRLMPISCYKLVFSIHDNKLTDLAYYPNMATNDKKDAQIGSSFTYLYSLIPIAILLVFVFVWMGKKSKSDNPDIINLGTYRFDMRNSELLFNDQKIELTGKESDLLNLLYKSANSTVEKERILNSVWGDEGEYIGRTLDVFISKLRKKLTYDSNLKIVNIRGVGYKLVVNEQ